MGPESYLSANSIGKAVRVKRMAAKSKLNEVVVKDIKVCLKKGHLPYNVAQVYGVSERVIDDIQRGRTWKDVHVYEEDLE